MDKNEMVGALPYVLVMGLLMAGILGWGLNIWKLATMGVDPVGIFVLRIVGVFVAPIGGIIGWM